MIEKIYNYTLSNEKTIEKVILDDNVNINHMTLPKGEGFPEHFSNSNVYIIIANGELNIKLGQQKAKGYSRGDIVNVPYNIKMSSVNNSEETVEIFVIKAPNPANYKG